MSLVNLLEAVKKLDNDDVFAVALSDDIEIVFRLPSNKFAGQIAHLISMTDESSLHYMLYDYVFRKCVLDNYLINFNESLPAGVPESIGKTILALSGADKEAIEYTKHLMDIYRETAQGIASFMKRTICTTFHGYTFQALDLLNYQELVEVFINAEQSLLDDGIIKERYAVEVGKKKDIKSLSQLVREDTKEYKAFNSVQAAPQDPEYDLKMKQREIIERERIQKGLQRG